MEAQLLILLNVAIACVLTGIIGYEREKAEKPVGLRTQMIIGGTAALLVSLGRLLINSYEDGVGAEFLRADPIRIIEAIIVGVSFIGAGTILKKQGDSNVLFLTTAATTLASAGIGIAVALHQYILAVGVAVLIFGITHFTKKVEDKVT